MAEEQLIRSGRVGFDPDKSAAPHLRILEMSVAPGGWEMPASSEVSLALTLSDLAATWLESGTLHNGRFPSGNISICRLEETRTVEMKSDATFALFSLHAEAFGRNGRESNIGLQPRDLIDDDSLRALLGILLKEQRSRFESGLLFLDSMTTTLAEYLKARYSAAMLTARQHKGGLARSVLRRCMEYIDAHLDEEIRLEDLVRESGVSSSHLIRSFRASTGKTPYQFVLERRIERAKGLMHDSRLSLTEIALTTGFANQHHLSRVFRKTAGLTPSEFRFALG